MKKHSIFNYLFAILIASLLTSCSYLKQIETKLGIEFPSINTAETAYETTSARALPREESVPQNMKMIAQAALGDSFDDSDIAQNSIYYANSSNSGAVADFGVNASSPYMNSARKLIRTVYIDSETTNFDKAYNYITESITSFDGYIENYDVDGKRISRPDILRRANFTLRIPRDKADEYIKSLESRLNFVHKNENLRDITLEYSDVETRKETLDTERKTLQALLKKATKVADTIQIESRISEIISELENIEKRLKRYDNNIDYTTIYLNIGEVKTVTVAQDRPTSVSIKEGFEQNLIAVKNFFIDLFVWIITHLPAISVIAILVLIFSFIKILKRAGKRRRHNIEDELE